MGDTPVAKPWTLIPITESRREATRGRVEECLSEINEQVSIDDFSIYRLGTVELKSFSKCLEQDFYHETQDHGIEGPKGYETYVSEQLEDISLIDEVSAFHEMLEKRCSANMVEIGAKAFIGKTVSVVTDCDLNGHIGRLESIQIPEAQVWLNNKDRLCTFHLHHVQVQEADKTIGRHLQIPLPDTRQTTTPQSTLTNIENGATSSLAGRSSQPAASTRRPLLVPVSRRSLQRNFQQTIAPDVAGRAPQLVAPTGLSKSLTDLLALVESESPDTTSPPVARPSALSNTAQESSRPSVVISEVQRRSIKNEILQVISRIDHGDSVGRRLSSKQRHDVKQKFEETQYNGNKDKGFEAYKKSVTESLDSLRTLVNTGGQGSFYEWLRPFGIDAQASIVGKNVILLGGQFPNRQATVLDEYVQHGTVKVWVSESEEDTLSRDEIQEIEPGVTHVAHFETPKNTSNTVSSTLTTAGLDSAPTASSSTTEAEPSTMSAAPSSPQVDIQMDDEDNESGAVDPPKLIGTNNGHSGPFSDDFEPSAMSARSSITNAGTSSLLHNDPTFNSAQISSDHQSSVFSRNEQKRTEKSVMADPKQTNIEPEDTEMGEDEAGAFQAPLQPPIQIGGINAFIQATKMPIAPSQSSDAPIGSLLFTGPAPASTAPLSPFGSAPSIRPSTNQSTSPVMNAEILDAHGDISMVGAPEGLSSYEDHERKEDGGPFTMHSHIQQATIQAGNARPFEENNEPEGDEMDEDEHTPAQDNSNTEAKHEDSHTLDGSGPMQVDSDTNVDQVEATSPLDPVDEIDDRLGSEDSDHPVFTETKTPEQRSAHHPNSESTIEGPILGGTEANKESIEDQVATDDTGSGTIKPSPLTNPGSAFEPQYWANLFSNTNLDLFAPPKPVPHDGSRVPFLKSLPGTSSRKVGSVTGTTFGAAFMAGPSTGGSGKPSVEQQGQDEASAQEGTQPNIRVEQLPTLVATSESTSRATVHVDPTQKNPELVADEKSTVNLEPSTDSSKRVPRPMLEVYTFEEISEGYRLTLNLPGRPQVVRDMPYPKGNFPMAPRAAVPSDRHVPSKHAMMMDSRMTFGPRKPALGRREYAARKRADGTLYNSSRAKTAPTSGPEGTASQVAAHVEYQESHAGSTSVSPIEGTSEQPELSADTSAVDLASSEEVNAGPEDVNAGSGDVGLGSEDADSGNWEPTSRPFIPDLDHEYLDPLVVQLQGSMVENEDGQNIHAEESDSGSDAEAEFRALDRQRRARYQQVQKQMQASKNYSLDLELSADLEEEELVVVPGPASSRVTTPPIEQETRKTWVAWLKDSTHGFFQPLKHVACYATQFLLGIIGTGFGLLQGLMSIGSGILQVLKFILYWLHIFMAIPVAIFVVIGKGTFDFAWGLVLALWAYFNTFCTGLFDKVCTSIADNFATEPPEPLSDYQAKRMDVVAAFPQFASSLERYDFSWNELYVALSFAHNVPFEQLPDPHLALQIEVQEFLSSGSDDGAKFLLLIKQCAIADEIYRKWRKTNLAFEGKTAYRYLPPGSRSVEASMYHFGGALRAFYTLRPSRTVCVAMQPLVCSQLPGSYTSRFDEMREYYPEAVSSIILPVDLHAESFWNPSPIPESRMLTSFPRLR
ncbi:hypothetical protein N0V90_007194 [Kalmusia sp. IMI 367209]|nr:hypothetical protein N0V90_007194 [Kalmusia sp. IMI 367209]